MSDYDCSADGCSSVAALQRCSVAALQDAAMLCSDDAATEFMGDEERMKETNMIMHKHVHMYTCTHTHTHTPGQSGHNGRTFSSTLQSIQTGRLPTHHIRPWRVGLEDTMKKCGKCTKTIYPADPELSMGDKTYHKSCSRCETCRGQLTISNFATSGDRLLCKVHFMKEFSESGGVYSGDDRFKQKLSRSNPPSRSNSTTSQKSDTDADKAENFAATLDTVTDDSPLQTKPNASSSPINSPKVPEKESSTAPGPRRVSVAEMIQNTQNASISDKSSPKNPGHKKKTFSFGEGGKKCKKCAKTIYPADPELSMGDNTYHKSCSKCETCRGQLTISNFATSGDRLLCKTHFMEEFAVSGGQYGGGDRFKKRSSSVSTPPPSTTSALKHALPEPVPESDISETADVVKSTDSDDKATVVETDEESMVSQENVNLDSAENTADKKSGSAIPAIPAGSDDEKATEEVVTASTTVNNAIPEPQEKKSVPPQAPQAAAAKATPPTPPLAAVKATPPTPPPAAAKKTGNKKKFSFGSNAPKCPVCTKSIYSADPSLSIADKTFHKACARCSTCKAQLTILNYATSGDRLLCKTHFKQEFSESGGLYGGDEKFSQPNSRSSSVS